MTEQNNELIKVTVKNLSNKGVTFDDVDTGKLKTIGNTNVWLQYVDGGLGVRVRLMNKNGLGIEKEYKFLCEIEEVLFNVEQIVKYEDAQYTTEAMVALGKLKEIKRTIITSESTIKNTTLNKGFVYLIKSKNGDIKIGKAKNVKQRIKELQIGSAEKLSLIKAYYLNDYSQFETMLHRKFKKYNTQGEWFAIDKDVLVKETDKLYNEFNSTNLT